MITNAAIGFFRDLGNPNNFVPEVLDGRHYDFPQKIKRVLETSGFDAQTADNIAAQLCTIELRKMCKRLAFDGTYKNEAESNVEKIIRSYSRWMPDEAKREKIAHKAQKLVAFSRWRRLRRLGPEAFDKLLSISTPIDDCCEEALLHLKRIAFHELERPICFVSKEELVSLYDHFLELRVIDASVAMLYVNTIGFFLGEQSKSRIEHLSAARPNYLSNVQRVPTMRTLILTKLMGKSGLYGPTREDKLSIFERKVASLTS
jgi:hypothetical protein